MVVDSEPTLAAAVAGGVREVVIDVNVGLPRCGIAPGRAGWLADRARAAGCVVCGVMGPAHVDPTVALHERMYLVSGEDVLDSWPVDLRG